MKPAPISVYDGTNPFEDPIVVLDLGSLGGQTAELRAWVDSRYHRGVELGVFEARDVTLDPDTELLVAVDRRTLTRTGFATVYEIEGNRLWVAQLWVEEDRRRQGIAIEILDRAIDVARARGHDAVLLGRAEHNAPMLALLEGAGWKVEHVVLSLKVQP